MKKYAVVALLVAVTLTLASCGGNSGGSNSGGQGGADDMQGMDHGGTTGMKESTGSTSGMEMEETTGGMQGMDHGSMGMGSGEMARQMVMEDGEYSDKAFIDAMVPHHQAAVDMAEVALKNAEHEEIKNLAEDVVGAQEAEIEQLKAIKKEQYGTSEVPMEMSDQDMQMMGMSMDPQQLAEQRPFDKAFIDNMIPHHRSAIAMARAALEDSDNPKIREIARAIVKAQKREIAQMERWREEWYPGA